MKARPGTLVLGWGNPGRLDDGLGPAFIEALSVMDLPGVALDSDYQLTMEDSADVAGRQRVLFVDADRSACRPFSMRRLRPSKSGSSFSTHSVAPGAVLALSRDLFRSEPEAWLLGIRGYEFDAFGEGLSEGARANLAEAVAFMRETLESGRFREFQAAEESPSNDADQEDEPCPTQSR